MKDDFARGKCPVCGCETMFRQNKNRILYTYCRNSHHVKFGRDDSISAIAQIASGKNWNNGLIYLYPLEQKKVTNGMKGNENETNRTKEQQTGTNGTNEHPTGTTGTSDRAGIFKSNIENKRSISGNNSATNTAGTDADGTDNDICGWL